MIHRPESGQVAELEFPLLFQVVAKMGNPAMKAKVGKVIAAIMTMTKESLEDF